MSTEANDAQELSAELDKLDVDYTDYTELCAATQYALHSRFIIGSGGFIRRGDRVLFHSS